MTARSPRHGLLLVLAAHAAVSALVFRYGTDLQDEGLLYAWARRILQGQLPYQDFYMVQAPGTFYVQAALMNVLGVSLLAGRIFKQAQGLLVIVLAYAVVREATGRPRSALAGAVATALFSAAHHYRMPWYGTDACIALLVATWLLCHALKRDRRWAVLAAGGALGLATLFKQNHGLFGVLALGAVSAFAAHRRTSGSSPRRLGAALAQSGVLVLGFLCVLSLFGAYFVGRGGSLATLALNTFAWASEAKDFPSPLQTALYPLQVFSLAHKGSVTFPLAALALIFGSALASWTRAPRWARVAGGLGAASTLALGADVFVRAYVWSFGSALVFAIAALAVADAARSPSDRALGSRPLARAAVALMAAANLYGGTIPGGGWGRLVETLPATLLAFGIGADLVTEPGGWVTRLWSAHVALAPRRVGLGLAGLSLAVSGGLLWKNQAFVPSLDRPLNALTQTARQPGWSGLRGVPRFVRETDELISVLRRLPGRERSVYVFPLNCALYPLAGVDNPTTFDSHQIDFLAPSRFGQVLEQLRRAQPSTIVLQRHPNASFEADAAPDGRWVHPALRDAVHAFVHRGYTRARAWGYYELWSLRERRE